ncbi:MAG: hypothetical protein LIP77_12210, partial [Planctomycetes bacterium]|nr:hypothetical protein [Planctomycetota bacterium]
MAPSKIVCGLLVITLALAAGGCSGGGRKRGSRSSKKPPKNGPQNHRASADLDDLSPEASLKRDLARLREREQQQARVVEEMRGALVQGEDVVIKEEQKLHQIRAQIASFDSDLRRYEMASARRSPAPAASRAGYDGRADRREGSFIPATAYAERDQRSRRVEAPRDGGYERAAYRDDREYDRPLPARREVRDDYGRDHYDARTGYDRDDSRRNQYSGGREEVLYAPPTANRPADRDYRDASPSAPSGFGDTRYGAQPASRGDWTPRDRLYAAAGPSVPAAAPTAPTRTALRPERQR